MAFSCKRARTPALKKAAVRRGSESLRPSKFIIRPRAIQRAVPRQRSGPRTVSPVVARLRAFAAFLRPGQRPSPTEGAKRGVGPFVAGRAGWWCWPLPGAAFCPSGRTMQAGPPGQCRRSIFVRDKAVISPPLTPSRNAGREGREKDLLSLSRPVLGMLTWLRFGAVEPHMAPKQRKRPPLSRFRWLRGGSSRRFPQF